MRVLITGASGFIGSHLIAAACAKFSPANVIAFSSKKLGDCQSIVYGGSGFNLTAADHALLATVEVLIHVGAFIPKNGLEVNLLTECNENIYFTENLLKLPFGSLKKIIYISTVDVYEPVDLTTESTQTLPATLYGLSKLYCENMVSIFSVKNEISFQILRVGHVYGPGEEKHAKFIPKAIKNILHGNAVELWGNGSEIRSFIYVDDVVLAIMNAVLLQENVGVINIVGGVPTSIRDLIDKLIVASGKHVEIIVKKYNGAKRNYIFDNAKLSRYLLPRETDFMLGLKAEFAYMAGLH